LFIEKCKKHIILYIQGSKDSSLKKLWMQKFNLKLYNLKLQNGQRLIDSNRKTGFIGLVYSLKNLLNLYEYLKLKYALNYLLSYKLHKTILKLSLVL